MIRAALTLILCFAPISSSWAQQHVVKVQSRGTRRPVLITVSGRLSKFDVSAVQSVRVGVASDVGGRQWMPVTGVDRHGAFTFQTELTEGDYSIIAGLSPFQLATDQIHVEKSPRRQSFKVDLITNSRYEWRAAGSDLHFDEPSELPPSRLLPNPEVAPPIPPAPPPPPPGPGWSKDKNKVRVFFATNRRLANAAVDAVGDVPTTSEFVNEPQSLRFGYYDVGVTFTKAADRNPLSSDRYQFESYTAYLYKDGLAFRAGIANDTKNRDVAEAVIFIHGYNTPFLDGLYRTAQLVVETGFHGVPIYFGWPGGEHWWEYPAATQQVMAAAQELASVLRLVATAAEVTKVHVVAHSMGNKVLVEAIALLAQDATIRTGKVSDLVMAAPDVVPSRLTQVAGMIRSVFRRSTVYVSDTDLALRVGTAFDHDHRVGERTPFSVPIGFEAVDATGAKDTIIGHSYFVETDTIANDLAAFVVRGESAMERGLRQTTDKGNVLWELPR